MSSHKSISVTHHSQTVHRNTAVLPPHSLAIYTGLRWAGLQLWLLPTWGTPKRETVWNGFTFILRTGWLAAGRPNGLSEGIELLCLMWATTLSGRSLSLSPRKPQDKGKGEGEGSLHLVLEISLWKRNKSYLLIRAVTSMGGRFAAGLHHTLYYNGR